MEGRTGDRSEIRERVSRRALLRVGGAAALTSFLTGCGAPAFFEKATDDRVTVEMTADRRYAPATLTIPLGTTVVWRNGSAAPHTATCDPDVIPDAARTRLPQGAPSWTSGDVYPGEQWSLTFRVAGTYVYSCRFHGESGMVGTIVVE